MYIRDGKVVINYTFGFLLVVGFLLGFFFVAIFAPSWLALMAALTAFLVGMALRNNLPLVVVE